VVVTGSVRVARELQQRQRVNLYALPTALPAGP
jgi:hypothetical protein